MTLKWRKRARMKPRLLVQVLLSTPPAEIETRVHPTETAAATMMPEIPNQVPLLKPCFTTLPDLLLLLRLAQRLSTVRYEPQARILVLLSLLGLHRLPMSILDLEGLRLRTVVLWPLALLPWTLSWRYGGERPYASWSCAREPVPGSFLARTYFLPFE